jgi:nucleotide-binding universal stress UspA family protein
LVLDGNAAEQILNAITSEQIDIVVLGSQGKGMLGRLLIGSTSDKVLSHAPCSVLLVPERPRP